MKINMQRLGSTLICFYMLTTLLLSVDSAGAQSVEGPTKQVTLAQMPLENVRIREESISGLFSRLALRYEIPIGLEIARPGRLMSFYRIEFRKGTLSELLTQFVAEHDEYTWKIKMELSVFFQETLIAIR